MLTLLVGGVRSGKSTLAVRLAERASCPVVVIATAEARDDEMRARIARHRAERPDAWSTFEEAVDLAGVIRNAPDDALLLVDCLTVWVSNLLERGVVDIEDRAVVAAQIAAERPSAVIAVTNEVGSGVVPANPLARRFTDALGAVNAIWARASDRTLLVVAGKVLRMDEPDV